NPSDSSITNSKVRFSWNPVANADGYIFQLSRNQPFTVLIRNLATVNSSIEVDSLVEGKRYFWRVIPFSKMDFCTQGSASFTFEVNSFTSVGNVTGSKDVNIFPNPARIGQNIYLDRINDTEKSNIRFFSEFGKDLTEVTVKNTNLINTYIQTEALQPGVYFIQINQKFAKIILTH
ncbi:MAG TPA: T9SS type A sorting domain-containing protein, partial [Saprospiraceae bacterium]|nr:T9SS type A sorting domain-containing protein [Saprospiraceae bacterium]